MRVIAFLSQKGGSGKTTLCVHTAVAAQEAKEQVVIIDTDPQKSALTWSQNRQAETPLVVAQPVHELSKVLAAAKDDGMTLSLIDTAPHAEVTASMVVEQSQLVVIPVRPTAFDLAAVMDSVRMVTALKAKAVMVLSACPPRAPEIAEARELLKKYGLPVFAGDVTDRRAFARAIASGNTVTEFEPEGKAALEIRSLWKYLKEKSK
jgi:chromosome partitioning protein